MVILGGTVGGGGVTTGTRRTELKCSSINQIKSLFQKVAKKRLKINQLKRLTKQKPMNVCYIHGLKCA